MSTHHENILQAIKTLCDGVPGALAYRSREAAIARREGPAILIRPEDMPVETPGQRVTIRDLVVLVTVIARGQVPDQVADPVVQAVHAAITADQTLGGLVGRIVEEHIKFDFEVADQNAVAIELRFRLRYMTPVADITRQA